MDFKGTRHGSLAIGTTTSFGEITQVSLTAYLMDGETWVSWIKVHGPYGWADPLVMLVG